MIVGVAAVFCLIALTGFVSIKKIPAKGSLQSYAISTTVEDESAKYYLENYLAGNVTNVPLHKRISKVHEQL